MGQPLTAEETLRIRERLDEGRSHNWIAKELGRAQSTVSAYARRQGYSPLSERTPHVANQARRDYARAERIELLNTAFATGEEMLKRGGLSAREFKEVMTGIAIGIDKRRLEEGEPNSVHESPSGHPHAKLLNLEEEFKRLDEQLEE
jgi:predicted transcriptional regulator